MYRIHNFQALCMSVLFLANVVSLQLQAHNGYYHHDAPNDMLPPIAPDYIPSAPPQRLEKIINSINALSHEQLEDLLSTTRTSLAHALEKLGKREENSKVTPFERKLISNSIGMYQRWLKVLDDALYRIVKGNHPLIDEELATAILVANKERFSSNNRFERILEIVPYTLFYGALAGAKGWLWDGNCGMFGSIARTLSTATKLTLGYAIFDFLLEK